MDKMMGAKGKPMGMKMLNSKGKPEDMKKPSGGRKAAMKKFLGGVKNG